MARTHIVSATGTRFIPATSARRTTLLICTILAGLIIVPFFLAAMIGLTQAIKNPATTAPLHESDKITVSTNCWTDTTDEADTLIIRCD